LPIKEREQDEDHMIEPDSELAETLSNSQALKI
jgi:hypothetical protein